MRSWILTAFCFLLFNACQRKTLPPYSDKQTMRICLNMDPPHLDTRKSAEVCTSTLSFLIYEGLTRIRPDGEADLALAESVEISPDGLVYEFHLREAYWTDGVPITAHDFEYSWKKILTPQFASPCPHLLFPIKNAEKAASREVSPDLVGVRALDSQTLRVELENPTLYFLSLISFCNFYPIPRHLELKNPSWQTEEMQEFVSSGPFKLVKWVRNKEIVLEKNPSYWDQANVYLQNIHISIIRDEKTVLQMFQNKELDFISTVTTPLSLEDLAYCRSQNNLLVKPIGGLLFCSFNLDRFPFNNRHIRKALALSIDRKSIIENISQLSEAPATRWIPPILIGKQNRELFPAFDPQLAKTLFAKGIEELGILDPNEIPSTLSDALILSYDGVEQHRKIAQAIQQQWKNVLGIDVKLQEFDFKTHLDRLLNRNYFIGLDYSIVQYNDPNNILERYKYRHMKKNLPGFENAKYISLLNNAACMIDGEKRLEILEEAEELLMSEMPITPIYHFNQGVLIDPKYSNVQFSPLGNLLYHKIRPAA